MRILLYPSTRVEMCDEMRDGAACGSDGLCCGDESLSDVRRVATEELPGVRGIVLDDAIPNIPGIRIGQLGDEHFHVLCV